MKLVKGQEFEVSRFGPILLIPITLLTETPHQELDNSEDMEAPAIFGGWSMSNPFTPPVPGAKPWVAKYKTVIDVTKEEIFLMVDRRTELKLRCMDVGFGGDKHKFAVSKGKQDTFMCLMTDDSLRRMADDNT